MRVSSSLMRSSTEATRIGRSPAVLATTDSLKDGSLRSIETTSRAASSLFLLTALVIEVPPPVLFPPIDDGSFCPLVPILDLVETADLPLPGRLLPPLPVRMHVNVAMGAVISDHVRPSIVIMHLLYDGEVEQLAPRT